jgi:hypothetical protein
MNRTTAEHLIQIFWSASDHVVQSDDLAATFVAKQIHDVRADKTGAAGHKNALALQVCHDGPLFICSNQARVNP